MDISNTIIPKSDQLNSDDLISGPITITITKVTKGASPEQPVAIHYQGSDRPYKPSKSMRRVIIAMWGSKAEDYVGRRLTLFREPSVKWAGQPVGGIRISHASDIDGPLTLALTETRGSRKPFVVQPLPAFRADTVARNSAQSQATAPDASLDEAIFAAEQIGPEKARQGIDALREWFASLPAGVKSAIKPKLDAEWKPLAADANSNGGANE